MLLNEKTWRQRRDEKQALWHTWFAWRPVWLDRYPDLADNAPCDPTNPEETKYSEHGIFRVRGERVWLETVYRRAYRWVAIDHVLCATWHYRRAHAQETSSETGTAGATQGKGV